MQDYENFMAYICKAYKGYPKPEACRSLSTEIESTEKVDLMPQVCYEGEARSFTSLGLAEKIPR